MSPSTHPCPLCGADTDPAFTTSDRNQAISSEPFDYRRCVACASLHLENVPANLGDYYPQDYYSFPPLPELERSAASPFETAKLDMLRAQRPPGRMLEIGAGFGIAARAARSAGWQVTAIEMDARCCEYLEQVVGVEAICSDQPEQLLAEMSPSETIVMWHVLEHLPRPWDVLAAIAQNLEPGGVLGLAVPNPDSLQFRLLRGRWAHVDAPRHVFLIPSATLVERASRHGLRLVELTSSDPVGHYWNRFGWEYALRRFPARRGRTRLNAGLALAITAALRPLEGRRLRGTAYTAVFVKDG